MKKPFSELPFSGDDDDGYFDIMDKNNVIIGTLHYASDFEYMLEACNNYQEAIKLLMKILAFYKLDTENYTDGEILDLIKPEIDKFLNKINDENTK